MASAGGLLLLGIAVGWIPAGYIQFDPSGITIATRNWAYTVPWDSVGGIATQEMHDNAVLLIWLHDLDAVVAHPPARKARVLKHFKSNQLWMGAPVFFMPSLYGIDLPLLVQAMERYVADPSARATLGLKLVANQA